MVSVFEITYSINLHFYKWSSIYTSKFVRNPEKFQFKSGSQYQNHKLELRVGRGFCWKEGFIRQWPRGWESPNQRVYCCQYRLPCYEVKWSIDVRLSSALKSTVSEYECLRSPDRSTRNMESGEVIFSGYLFKSPPESKLRNLRSVSSVSRVWVDVVVVRTCSIGMKLHGIDFNCKLAACRQTPYFFSCIAASDRFWVGSVKHTLCFSLYLIGKDSWPRHADVVVANREKSWTLHLRASYGFTSSLVVVFFGESLKLCSLCNSFNVCLMVLP